MKKISILVLSFFCCFSVFADATLDDLLTELELIRDQQSSLNNLINDNFTPSYDEGAEQNIYDLLWYALDSYYVYPSIQEVIANLDSVVQDFFNTTFLDFTDVLFSEGFSPTHEWLSSIFYFLSDNWQVIENGFSQNHLDLVEVSQAIRNLEGKQEALILGTNGQLELLGNNLQEIIGLLQNQSGGSSGDLPIDTVG